MGNDRHSRSKSQSEIRSCDGKPAVPSKNEKKTKYASWSKYRKLHVYDEVPKHLQTNSFILTGYRYDLSCSECATSLFFFHNETLNIWTHSIGFAVFTWFLIRDFITSNPDENFLLAASIGDNLVLLFYIASILSCMTASTMLHLFSGCSVKSYNTCLQLDLWGITLATLASFVSGLHLLFKCHLYTRIFYQLATVVLIMIVVMHHASKHDDVIDSAGFIAVSLAGFVPLFHGIYINGLRPDTLHFVGNIIIFYILFGVGVFFFLTKIPERFAPGCFDYVGASHQLWHIFSLAAFCWWYGNSVEWIKYHQRHACTTGVLSNTSIRYV